MVSVDERGEQSRLSSPVQEMSNVCGSSHSPSLGITLSDARKKLSSFLVALGKRMPADETEGDIFTEDDLRRLFSEVTGLTFPDRFFGEQKRSH